jgi:hypothetical protein
MTYKALIIPCKVFARELELRLPLELYEAAVAAAEGDPVEFTGTCPDCRENDPFLALMDKYGIRSLGNNKRSSG